MQARGPLTGGVGLALGLAAALVAPAAGSDHGDTPVLIDAGRHDARLTDLYAFTRESNLVLVVCLDPTIPGDVTKYVFAPDLTVEIFIDTNSEVSFDDPAANAEFGGTVVRPDRIKRDVSLRIDFDRHGAPRLKTKGIANSARREIQLFAGLRDDPFIRGPRIGRNSAAIVVELPLDAVLDVQETILVWATSSVPGFRGKFQEMAGRALRSQFPENHEMNAMDPSDHARKLAVPPDVMIYDTSRPAAFPNGRDLPDDVVDLVGDERVLGNDFPFPDANDLPFLAEFPYLSAPHPPQ